jgi:hypothetical protein
MPSQYPADDLQFFSQLSSAHSSFEMEIIIFFAQACTLIDIM